MMGYQEYLKSERWQTLSEVAKVVADKKCQLCNSTDRIETHHRSYENIETEMEFHDLIVLCHECHEKYHVDTIGRCDLKELVQARTYRLNLSKALLKNDMEKVADLISNTYV